ncbi:uncharacterized protein LOC117180896 isoform X2 [Belonocnema kinseyi]|uniref:uncharacterized protein LOC117180896 isoform X2 n=1 Tax=Belonocnema kinseyi TaxID=2817044 RepID=UPI00143D805B|nr:uncharacterized protein LOC117180896 isoform X2 [Belonocnema kinseyi]
MYTNLIIFVIILSCFVQNQLGSVCYPNYCQKETPLNPEIGLLCLLTPVERGEETGMMCLLTSLGKDKECLKLKFENLGHLPPPGVSLVNLKLSAYVFVESLMDKMTAFNLSVSDINFRRLVTRYQSVGQEKTSACRHVEFYGNTTQKWPKDFYISCPFSDEKYETTPYRLEYLVEFDNYEYSRKLVFIVPRHRYIDENVFDVKMFTPFLYVDVSDTVSLTLFIQPLPERFNISDYRVWLINSGTGKASDVILSAEKGQHIRHSFLVDEGVHYFKVAALHPDCNQYGCLNSTSPLISIKQVSHRLLIMIISVIWIPPILFYAMYHVYKVYKKKVMLENADVKPNCLLVYSPTHPAHVNVMIELSRYLRGCSINAMIDCLDISETVSKDPGLWCNDAFHSADVILIASSPYPSETNVPVIYRNMDKQALRLLKENYPQGDKNYFSLQFPYCELESVPQEARHFKRFFLPDDLEKLVKTIHNVESIEIFGVSSRNFIEAVKVAKIEAIRAEDKSSRSTDETENLLTPMSKEKIFDLDQEKETDEKEMDVSEGSISPKYFKTNIEELNLLGENGEGEGEILAFIAQNDQSEFRVENLDL